MDFDLDGPKPRHNADEQRSATFGEKVTVGLIGLIAFLGGVWAAIWLVLKIFELIGRF